MWRIVLVARIPGIGPKLTLRSRSQERQDRTLCAGGVILPKRFLGGIMRRRCSLSMIAALITGLSPSWARDSDDHTIHHVSRCYIGTELDQDSRVAVEAQKTAWDFVAKEFQWDAKRRPKAVVCDLVWMLIVDYRPDNPRAFVTYVTINAKTMEVVQVFLEQ